ncbi:MAG: polysaccharide biosynthesis/export family protein [Phycisphaerales bacterium JB040]
MNPSLRNAPILALGAALVGAAGLTGCNADSFIDPSVVGRWERTPTRVPILTSIAVIEDPEYVVVEPSSIQPSDLIPESDPYIIGPGDIITLTVYDLIQVGVPEQYPRQVDSNGFIEVPQLGRFRVAGLTEDEVVQRVKEKAAAFIDDPLVSAVTETRRQQTFHIMGGVPEPGPYLIPSADYKLLEALISGGWSSGGAADKVYVIRQVALTPEAAGDVPANNGAAPGQQQEPDEDLLDVIDDLSQPSPGAFEAQPDQPDPVVDLITGERERPENRQPAAASPSSPTRWVFRDGRWIRVQSVGPVRVTPPGQTPDPLADATGLVTQRVIEVPVKPLLQGDARYNIIVRPGDVIRVPLAQSGVVYIGGQVARPGSFNLPTSGKLTLTRAITASGGLNTIAIPERVDLTRIVGTNEQATVMLNLRAIAEGTQPDIYLKPDDHINIGTNFWATPLAVIRNGFRASYGFGFLLDRNFGNDVFGAPPTNIR